MTAPGTGVSPTPATTSPPVPASSGVDATAAAITGDSGTSQSDTPTLELRQAVITAVDLAAATCSVAIGGESSDTAVPNVHYLSNYKPTVNDTCWVLVNGPDILALDRDGKFGAAAYAGLGVATVDTQETRNSSTFGNLATVGPQVATTIPASGKILVQVSADVQSPIAGSASAWMGFAISGATTRAAQTREALMALTYNSSSFSTFSGGGGNFHSHSFSGSGIDPQGGSIFISGSTGSASGDSSHSHGMPSVVTATEIQCSKVTLITGLTPGAATVTAQYAGIGGTAVFQRRVLWVLPL